MGITVDISGGGKDFELAEDLYQAGVLADIVDKGLIDNKYKPGTKVHKCYFVWILSELDSDGRNKRVFESYTVSLDVKAGLRKRAKEFGVTDAQLEDLKAKKTKFDLDQFIGIKRMLVLNKEDGKDGKVRVSVTATMPLPKGNKGVDIPADFQRKQDRAG
jgi:hypothetical protein